MPDPLIQSMLCPVLIGRDAQVATVTRLLDRARTGQGQVVLISGEAGIGKSRLVAEAKILATNQGFAIRQGNCFEPDRMLPYAPLLDLLRTLPTESSLSPDLQLLLAGQHPGAAEEPEPIKRRLFAQFMGFFLKYLPPATGHQQLIVLEDLHWADDTTLEFLLTFARRVATGSQGANCLLLTFRSDELHPALTHFLAELERGRLASELTLSRFTRDETTAAIHAIFRQSKVRAEFVAALQTLTDGNPFFIEETLKALVAMGEIYQERGVWTRKPLHELHIPRTVQDAVHRRSGQLSAAAYTLLTTAAAAGHRFDFDLLQAVTGQPEEALLAQIKELIAAQLVRESEPDHFVFRHALTRQAIYNGLLGRERRTLHLALLSALESRATPGETLATQLADHAHASQQWAKSLRYSRQAAEQAQRLFAPRAAVEHFGRALVAHRHLTSAPSAEEQTLLRLRAQCYETLGEFDLARADYEQALTTAQGIADQRSAWENLFSLGFLWTARNMAQAGAYLDQALALARRMNDPALLAASLNRIGNWRLNMEQPLVALQLHHEALTILHGLADPAGLALTHDLLGITYVVSGDYPASVPQHNQALALYRQLANPMSLSSCLGSASMRGGCYQGDVGVFADASVAECWQLGTEAIHLAQQIGWGFGAANANAFLSLAMGVRGEYRRALTCARDAMDLALDVEAPVWQGVTHIAFGKTHHDCFDLPAALMHLDQALVLARSVGAHEFLNTALAFLASALIAAGDLARAQTVLNESPVLRAPPAAAAGQTGSQRLIRCARAELTLAQGDPQGALLLIEDLIATAHHTAEGAVIPRLWLLRGTALQQLKRWTEAEQTLRAGIATAQQQTLRPLLWRLHLALGQLYHTQRQRALAQDNFSAARTIVDQLAADLPAAPLRESLTQGFAALLPDAPKATPLRAAKQTFDGLTAREREVAALVAQGLANRAIAEQLVVSERTIEKHVENACGKLGFTSRTQLAVWATERGLQR